MRASKKTRQRITKPGGIFDSFLTTYGHAHMLPTEMLSEKGLMGNVIGDTVDGRSIFRFLTPAQEAMTFGMPASWAWHLLEQTRARKLLGESIAITSLSEAWFRLLAAAGHFDFSSVSPTKALASFVNAQLLRAGYRLQPRHCDALGSHLASRDTENAPHTHTHKHTHKTNKHTHACSLPRI